MWWGNMMGWGWGGYGGYGGWWLFGIVHMLLWWLLIVLAIVFLARWIFSGGHLRHGRYSEDRALTILRERYARGEIDKAEYEARKKDLL